MWSVWEGQESSHEPKEFPGQAGKAMLEGIAFKRWSGLRVHFIKCYFLMAIRSKYGDLCLFKELLLAGLI